MLSCGIDLDAYECEIMGIGRRGDRGIVSGSCLELHQQSSLDGSMRPDGSIAR